MKRRCLLFSLALLFSVSVWAQSDGYPFSGKGITEEVYIDGMGILKYVVFSCPFGTGDDFALFLNMLYFSGLEDGTIVDAGGKYVIDYDSLYWVVNNTNLSAGVKRAMSKHGCNTSTVRYQNSRGSTTFVFNFLNNKGEYEYIRFNAIKKK